jgi:isopenicillin N synthase-like dioxygenase
MKLSRGYEVSPEHVAAMFSERDVSVEAERADPEPSAARRLVGERFSAGPFRRPRDAYHAGEDGAVFFAPNAWPSENQKLREHMEAYYEHMEALSNRVLRLIALAANAPPDFFIQKSDRHCSNLQVANYPTLRSGDWEAPATAPPRKKAHADSGTITILARERRHIPSTQTPDADTRRGGLQVLVGDDVWADVPTLEGGARDGAEGAALLVNVGNQLQAWSDGYWRSTKHRVTNPTYVPLDEDNTDLPSSTRRVSVAFFHKANYDAAVDAKELLKFGGFGEAAARDVAARNAGPVVTAGELSRVGMLRKFAKQGMDAAQASMAYHEALMGAEAAAEAAGSSFHGGRAFKRFSNGASRKKPSPSRRDVSAGAARGDGVRCRCCPPVSGDGLGFDRGSDDRGAGLGNDNPSARCPVCKGTGWKPCGQCDGTGVNQDDLFGGKFLKGDTCWLCSGKAKTMCGNCIDLTDSF